MKNYLFLIGAAKAGTTALANSLGEHPDIALAREKEPMYFTDYAQREWRGRRGEGVLRHLVADREDYERLFDHKPHAAWRLDASTDYFYNAAAAERIREFSTQPGVGRVVIAVLLRDPVERVISQYQHTIRDGYEDGTLLDALGRERERMDEGAHPLFYHVERSRYATHLAMWRSRFPRLLILDYHRLGEADVVTGTVAKELGLAPHAIGSVRRMNESHVHRSRLVRMALYHDGVKQLGRLVFPQRLRGALWQSLNTWNKTTYRPRDVEVETIRRALRTEISQCLADPGIPTDRWRLARG